MRPIAVTKTWRSCEICKKQYHPQRKEQRVCSRSCVARLPKRPPKIRIFNREATCRECGVRFWPRNKYKQSKFCSARCTALYCGRKLGKWNTLYCSERMRKNNPMHMPGVREKATATLRRIGHRPSVQGGNGRGPTVWEARLCRALNRKVYGWEINHVVKTLNGYLPAHYKLDVAHPVFRVAIEVDGETHGSKLMRYRDERKDRWLRGHRWKALRFKNHEIEEELPRVVATVLQRCTISK